MATRTIRRVSSKSKKTESENGAVAAVEPTENQPSQVEEPVAETNGAAKADTNGVAFGDIFRHNLKTKTRNV